MVNEEIEILDVDPDREPTVVKSFYDFTDVRTKCAYCGDDIVERIPIDNLPEHKERTRCYRCLCRSFSREREIRIVRRTER